MLHEKKAISDSGLKNIRPQHCYSDQGATFSKLSQASALAPCDLQVKYIKMILNDLCISGYVNETETFCLQCEATWPTFLLEER